MVSVSYIFDLHLGHGGMVSFEDTVVVAKRVPSVVVSILLVFFEWVC